MLSNYVFQQMTYLNNFCVYQFKKIKINHMTGTILDVHKALFPRWSSKERRIGRNWLHETKKIE